MSKLLISHKNPLLFIGESFEKRVNTKKILISIIKKVAPSSIIITVDKAANTQGNLFLNVKSLSQNDILTSKVIDGRFPDYSKVIPKENDKVLEIQLNEFKNSIERVTTVSTDRKEGLRMNVSKELLQFSVNSPNSGEGVENIKAKFNSTDISISFNSRYLIDIASQIENDLIILNLKDAGSPVLIKDLSDNNSFHVVMPMKI